MSTSERVSSIVKCKPDDLWCLNDIYESFTKSGGEATKKTVINCLSAHPDVIVVKSGSHRRSRVIGYRAKPYESEGVFNLVCALGHELGFKWTAAILIPIGLSLGWGGVSLFRVIMGVFG